MSVELFAAAGDPEESHSSIKEFVFYADYMIHIIVLSY